MTLQSLLKEHRPQIVLHLAAQPLVRASYDDPVGTFATNVMGTVNMLQAVRGCDSIRALVNVTTDKCYENKEWIWGYRETEPLGGHDPYSASKACAEIVTAAYRSSYFANSSPTAIASARAGNVVGGGDWAADRLVPDALNAFAEGRPVVLRNPTATRPWQHVLEPLSGYLLLAQKLWENGPQYASAYNFGPSETDALPVSEVVDQLAELWGKGATWQQDPGSHPHEAHLLRLDCSKARVRLGYTPRLPLRQALEWIVDWHREWLAGGDIRALTEAQIERFMALGQEAVPQLLSTASSAPPVTADH
jgi:CDP-glucose 4,6-dehydratase